MLHRCCTHVHVHVRVFSTNWIQGGPSLVYSNYIFSGASKMLQGFCSVHVYVFTMDSTVVHVHVYMQPCKLDTPSVLLATAINMKNKFGY